MGVFRVADGQADAFLMCVADGVGSEPLSQLGSHHACPLLHAAVRPWVTPLLMGDESTELPDLCEALMKEVAKGLLATATRVDLDPKQLSTTLVGALIEASPRDPYERRYLVFGVGDSGAFLLRDGFFHPLFADEHDTTITSTGTNALPTSLGRVVTCGGTLAPGEMLMICTDGLSNPMRNVRVSERLAEWWSQGAVPTLPQFGWQLSFRAKSYSDDRTAVCAWSLL
jgi:serine/threonine protein phosphatase PrpC